MAVAPGVPLSSTATSVLFCFSSTSISFILPSSVSIVANGGGGIVDTVPVVITGTETGVVDDAIVACLDVYWFISFQSFENGGRSLDVQILMPYRKPVELLQ